MKRIATAAVLIPIVLLAVFRAPNWAFSLFVGTVALIALREFVFISRQYGIWPFRRAMYVLVALLFGAAMTDLRSNVESISLLFEVLLIVPACLFLALGLRRLDLRSSFPAASASLLGTGYIAMPLLALVSIQQLATFWVFYLFLVVWIGDTFAYYVGRMIGKHRMAPTVSPGKTWEGAFGSLIGSVLIGVLMLRFEPSVCSALSGIGLGTRLFSTDMGCRAESGFHTILLPLAINIAAQIGDLAESMLKRGANVKDSGSILPGHGGMLDRIDALLFAAPVMWYYAIFHS